MNKTFATAALALSVLAPAVSAEFTECKFNFGRMWSNSFNASTSFAGQGLSHLAIWLGDNATYNTYWEGAMVKAASSNNLTPVIYAYVIAEYGKDNGLGDCDVTANNHCTGGANLIRNNWNAILSRYNAYAQGIASDYGTSKNIIWLIEPDFIQYSVTGDQLNTRYAQSGGGIPDADLAGRYFNDIVNAIKSKLPNAKIAVDISPWINNNITTWYNNFDKSKVNYLFTSGGRTQGGADRIRSDNNNNVTWSQASQAMGGKKIIADDGYGVGGGSNSDYQDWMSTSNISARIANGVIGITVQEPNNTYTSFAASNSNISVPCGGTPSSIAVSSSSQAPSSVAVSSSSRPLSSSVVVSSSSRPLSSSVMVSSSSRPSSSTITPSSSATSSTTGGAWSATNASLTNTSNAGVSIGAGNDWNAERVITKGMGTVNSGSAYTLKFDGELSRGGQDMSVQISLGSYCRQSQTFNGSSITSFTCTFTATSTGSVTLSLTMPGSRWETLTISNLSLTGPAGEVPTLYNLRSTMHMARIQLRGGHSVSWEIPAQAQLQVLSVVGQAIRIHSTDRQIDLSALPAGIYMLRSISAQGTSIKQIVNR